MTALLRGTGSGTGAEKRSGKGIGAQTRGIGTETGTEVEWGTGATEMIVSGGTIGDTTETEGMSAGVTTGATETAAGVLARARPGDDACTPQQQSAFSIICKGLALNGLPLYRSYQSQ